MANSGLASSLIPLKFQLVVPKKGSDFSKFGFKPNISSTTKTRVKQINETQQRLCHENYHFLDISLNDKNQNNQFWSSSIFNNIVFFLSICQLYGVINSQVGNFVVIVGELTYAIGGIIVMIAEESRILYLIFGKLLLKDYQLLLQKSQQLYTFCTFHSNFL